MLLSMVGIAKRKTKSGKMSLKPGYRCSDSFSITLQAFERDLHYFKLFLHDNNIYPLTNSMAAGPNFFSASFPIENKQAILDYLQQHGIGPHDE